MSDLLKVERCWSSERERDGWEVERCWSSKKREREGWEVRLWKDDWRSVKEEMVEVVEVVEGLRTPTKGFNSHSLLYRVG